jgi:hypothetical protein
MPTGPGMAKPSGVPNPTPNLSHKRLREILHYDPETGTLTWRIGQRAGLSAGFPHNGTHLRIGIDGRSYFAHRVIWFLVTGAWPESRIDHRDRNGFNNAWVNLRQATVSQNQANRTNEAGRALPKGVELHVSGQYRARITKDQKTIHLGLFDSPQAAHAAYVAKATTLFGEFARAA